MNDPTPSSVGTAASSSVDEAAKFEFNRDLENRKLDLEERKLAQNRWDTWARLISTIIVSGLLTVGFGGYTWWSDRQAKRRAEAAEAAAKQRAEHTQRAQVAIELVNARERASADLRAQMFTALLQNYFRNASDRERIAILELIALNFRDSVQIRPMLELLDARLRAAPASAEKSLLITELRRAGRLVARDQLEQVQQSKLGAVSRLTLKVGETGSPECLPPLKITLDQIQGESSILVRTNSIDGKLRETNGDESFPQFDVSYYDMPMVDYKTVKWPANELVRYSITIGSLQPGKGVADLYVACLPGNQIDAARRYAFDELLEQYFYSN